LFSSAASSKSGRELFLIIDNGRAFRLIASLALRRARASSLEHSASSCALRCALLRGLSARRVGGGGPIVSALTVGSELLVIVLEVCREEP
jgi:hypothetical protein